KRRRIAAARGARDRVVDERVVIGGDGGPGAPVARAAPGDAPVAGDEVEARARVAVDARGAGRGGDGERGLARGAAAGRGPAGARAGGERRRDQPGALGRVDGGGLGVPAAGVRGQGGAAVVEAGEAAGGHGGGEGARLGERAVERGVVD